jgi:hypothetical protein
LEIFTAHSGRLTMIVVQLGAPDSFIAIAAKFFPHDQLIAKPLVIPLVMVRRQE